MFFSHAYVTDRGTGIKKKKKSSNMPLNMMIKYDNIRMNAKLLSDIFFYFKINYLNSENIY